MPGDGVASCSKASTSASTAVQQTGKEIPARGHTSTNNHTESEGGSSGGMLARLGQNFNAAGISLFLRILGGDKRLALPHVSVPHIGHVDWGALAAAGFKGVVLDKDNTLTAPFALEVDARVRGSLAAAREAFGPRGLVLLSNSAGLEQYDPHGEEAAALEAALGVAVLRHREKKPSGGRGEVEGHFGCDASHLVMVGDRYLTDVVYGNRHGMLTIRPAPLVAGGEPLGVTLARKTEDLFVGQWAACGLQPPDHPLVPDQQFGRFVLQQPRV